MDDFSKFLKNAYKFIVHPMFSKSGKTFMVPKATFWDKNFGVENFSKKRREFFFSPYLEIYYIDTLFSRRQSIQNQILTPDPF